MTTRACLYARYSTDKQSENSIDDQLRAARARAEAESWTVVATHADEGISGSTPVALRAGGKALLADALASRFDVLVLEGLDRLSREIGEAESIVKRLEHRGLRIIGTSDGYDTLAKGRKVMRIARGLVNELYLDDLREKTHRGLAGQFDRGLSAGGRSYGYRSEDALGGKRLVVDAREAEVVRWVFEQFAEGHSTRSIAHQLNERGTPSSRGGSWAVSALQGSSGKGLGMLNNEIYIGRVVWNRRQWLKDPDTGRRRYIERPQSEWQTREAPELRIVPQELWDRVQQRARTGPPRGTRVGRGAVPKTLFGGLLRCATCGGPVVAVNSQRYGCSVHHDRGVTVCSSSLTVKRDRLDQRLVAELRDELLAPAAIAEFHSTLRDLVAQQHRGAGDDHATLRRRLHAIDGDIERLVDVLVSMGKSEAITARLQAAEAERARIRTQLQAPSTSTSTVIEDALNRYRKLVFNVQQALTDEEDRARTRHILAELLGPVTVGRDLETGETYAEIEEPAERLLLAAVNGSMGLVAGGRNSYRRLVL